MIDLITKAKKFATKAHAGQVRKGDGKPYITHPEAVYKIAKTVTNDESILAACWLHDTLEDTDTTYNQLEALFGDEVTQIVEAVSENKSIDDWHTRKADYLKKVSQNPKAQIVAWADKMHNTQDLVNVKDVSVFNVSIIEKLAFYEKFANSLPDKKLTKLLLDTIYDIV